MTLCSVDGRERWRYAPGRSVQTRAGSYPPPFSVRALAVTKLGDRMIIALSSSQHPYAPAQVSLLSGDGKLLGEYWHFGHLPHIDFATREGHPLLYLGGISNNEHAATLIVLDPMLMHDVRQASNGPFLGIERLKENARILFPRSTMNQRFESYNGINMIEVVPEGLNIHDQERFGNGIGLTTIIYHLDPNLRLKDIGASDLFTLDHEHLLPSPGTMQEEITRLTTAYRTSTLR